MTSAPPHAADLLQAARAEAARPLRVALAGNPNCGKTTLFNALTGARQHVANYPGVTVERRSGSFALGARRVELVDLPGTYSLGSFTPEERVAQEELAAGFDVVLVVADSTNLQRHLVLLTQLLHAGANAVLCLNMADEARAAGQVIDQARLEARLGLPVVETEGHRRVGLEGLREALARAAGRTARPWALPDARLAGAEAAVRAELPEGLAGRLSTGWVATRLLVGDAELSARAAGSAQGRRALEVAAAEAQRLQAETGRDAALLVTAAGFAFVDGLLREATVAQARPGARRWSDRVDAVAAHPWLGLPLFAAVMYAIFWTTFSLGEAPMGWIQAAFGWLGGALSSLWPEGSGSPLRSLLVDGVIGGVGGVVVFLPNILLLFLGLALLEDTGYLARAAFLTDRVMHRFGLHGKSFIPLLSGFGCSVPAVMATRTLENERDRIATMLVLPLMSCGARLPIWMLLIPAFFPPALRAPALWGIYALGIALALGLALLLRRTVLRGEDAPFVMELPPYRLPTPRAVLLKMLERAALYLKKAGTIILVVSVLLWAATTWPKASRSTAEAQLAVGTLVLEGGAAPAQPGARLISAKELANLRAAEDLEASVAGRVGHALEPAFRPLGFDWRIVTALLGAFAAKEVFVAQLGIVYAVGKTEKGDEEGAAGLRAALARDYPPLVGFGLMVFLLVATPCMSTVAVTRREAGRWRWAALQFGGLTGIAWLLALLVFQAGRLLA